MTRRRLVIWGLVAAVILVGGLGYYYYMSHLRSLPAGIASGNGRLEAQEVAIATKYAGRIAEIKFKEGDLVERGQVLARMDTSELEAALRSDKEKAIQRTNDRDAAKSAVQQRQAERDLAQIELNRANALVAKDAISRQRVDQLRAKVDTTTANLAASNSDVQAAEAAIASVNADADRVQSQINDSTLVAPMMGRILQKTSNVGETLAQGGQVGTMLDLSDVYLTMFLVSADAARTSLGAPARIVLDAVPDRPIPAAVSFVSPQAQFTPKQVETKEERERMMFRVKLSIPPALVKNRIEVVKTGITGMGYVKFDQKAVWPEWLQSDLTTSDTAAAAAK